MLLLLLQCLNITLVLLQLLKLAQPLPACSSSMEELPEESSSGLGMDSVVRLLFAFTLRSVIFILM